MTAVFTVHLSCECGCKTKPPGQHECRKVFPPTPRPGTAKSLRADASAAGWEVSRGNHGRDVCPECRVAEIRKAAGIQEEPGDR